MGKDKTIFNYITLSRGFAIAWIVISHAAIPQIRAIDSFSRHFFILMYSIALPMFMCLSGHLFEVGLEKYKRQGYSTFLRGKFHRLMIPYFIFLLLAYLVMAIGATNPFVSSLLERFSFNPRSFWQAAVEIVSLDNIVSKHLWYCYTLFLIFAISYPLEAFWKRWPGLVISFLCYLIAKRYSDELPAMVERVCHYLIFFQTGRWMKAAEKWFRPSFLPVYFVATAAFYVADNSVDAKAAGLFGGTLVYALGITGALFFFTLMRVLAKDPASRILNELGEYSYDIYLIHQPVLTAGTAGLLWTFYPWMWPWAIIAIGAAVGFVSSYLISRYIIRPVPVLRYYLVGMKK